MHLLTPGTGSYAALKIGAVAGVAGLRIFASRRSRARAAEEATVAPGATAGGESAESARRTAHPRSKKKRARRRG